ncbi:hypothetical protein LCGC14_2311660 [marine sediment metagenome]|uniref:Uncharacterized protein n=1 Tax=marine sediment metagenome TaxID=412755 RepID=A0A0F9CKJ8_9ZZZZ
MRRLATAYFSYTTSSGRAGDETSTFYDHATGCRFTSVTIPQGDTINTASMQFRAAALVGTIPLTKIDGEDADNAVEFVSAGDYDARGRTATSVDWTPGAWSGTTWYTSTDIKGVIQDIIDRGSWSSGNALVLFHNYDALGWAGSAGLLQHYGYDSGYGPKLDIDYSPGGGVTVTPTTLALILSEFVPTVSTPRLITPPTLALTLTEFAPSVVVGIIATPGVATLSTTPFAPTILLPVTATPTTLALILAEFAPTVSVGIVVTVPLATLSLSTFVPTISTPRLVTPTTLALILTEFVPLVSVGAAIEVTPGTLALILATFAPTAIPSTYESYGTLFLYTAANWDGSLEFFLEVYCQAVAGTVRARLWNVTDGAVVAGSGLSTASASYTRLRSGALTLTDGKSYLVQFGTEEVANGAFKSGKIIAV